MYWCTQSKTVMSSCIHKIVLSFRAAASCSEAEFLKQIEGWNRLRGIGLEKGLPMLHKMLIFKRGIDFSLSCRRNKVQPDAKVEQGIYPVPTLLQSLESMPTWN